VGSTVGTVTSLQVCTIWGLIPGRGNISFFLLKNTQTSSEAQPAYYSMDRGSVFFCWGLGSLGLKLATHIHLVPRFRMCAAIILLPLYAFMTHTHGQFYLYKFVKLYMNGHGEIPHENHISDNSIHCSTMHRLSTRTVPLFWSLQISHINTI